MKTIYMFIEYIIIYNKNVGIDILNVIGIDINNVKKTFHFT